MPTFSSSPLGMLAAFLLTYALHSTALLGAAWLATRRLAGRHAALEEWIWRSALVGGLLTAAIQLSLPNRPWQLETAELEAATVAQPVERKASPSRTPWLEVRQEARLEAHANPASAASRPVSSPTPAARFSAGWVVLPWAAVAVVLLSLLALRWWSFRRALSGRRSVREGHLLSLLDHLADRAGLARRVRLSASERFAVPFARGLAQPEICMPERALTALAPSHQEGILAHEVAHLVRRDPTWILALRLFESLFFFQPLNRLAGRRLTALAELRCDDWAARATGKGRDLAICLTEVAAWMVKGESRALAPAMAASRSGLAQRIERLLASEKGGGESAGIPRWLPWAGLAALSLVLLLVPGATLAGGETGEAVPAAGAAQAPVKVAAGTAAPGVRKLSRYEDRATTEPYVVEGMVPVEARGPVEGVEPMAAIEPVEANHLAAVLAELAELEGVAPMAELAGLAELDRAEAIVAKAELTPEAVESWRAVRSLLSARSLRSLEALVAALDTPPAPPAPPTPPAPPAPPAPPRAHRAYASPPEPPSAPTPPAPPSPPTPPPGRPRYVDRDAWEMHHRSATERDAYRAEIGEAVEEARRQALAEARAVVEQHREQIEQVRRQTQEALERHRGKLDAALRSRLEAEVDRGVQREVVEQSLAEARASLDRALAEARRAAERAIAEASREVERAVRELERARRDLSIRDSARAPRAPGSPVPEETPEPPR